VFQFPIILGAIAVCHTVSTSVNNLHIRFDTLAQVFQGQITSWNHPDLRMSAMMSPLTGNSTIQVVRRLDSSGTTFAFTDAINRAVPSLWKFGANSLPNWQNGTIAGNGNLGVIGALMNVTNGIAYVEYGQALTANLPMMRVKNQANTFIVADPIGAAVAADSSLAAIPDSTASFVGFSIANAAGSDSYPISTFSYLLLRADITDQGNQGCALKAFLLWTMSDAGQAQAISQGLVPLSSQITQKNLAGLNNIKVTNNTLVKLWLSMTPNTITIDEAPFSSDATTLFVPFVTLFVVTLYL